MEGNIQSRLKWFRVVSQNCSLTKHYIYFQVFSSHQITILKFLEGNIHSRFKWFRVVSQNGSAPIYLFLFEAFPVADPSSEDFRFVPSDRNPARRSNGSFALPEGRNLKKKKEIAIIEHQIKSNQIKSKRIETNQIKSK